MDTISVQGLPKLDNTAFSFYRGLRWLILLREIFYIPFSIYAVLKANYKWRNFDVIHVNEITEVFTVVLLKMVFAAPIVLHVRSVARQDKNSFRNKLVHSILKNKVSKIIAIDDTVKGSLNSDLDVQVIHNSFSFKHEFAEDLEFKNKLGKIDGNNLIIGYVGSLMVSKGILELVKAAKIVREKDKSVEFLIVGGETINKKSLKLWLLGKFGFSRNIGNELKNLLFKYKLTDSFHLVGATDNVELAYEKMDVLCVPGFFNAPGRQVFEGAFAGVPTILAITDPMKDTFIPMETGIAVQLKNPQEIADAILYFANQPSEIKRMGDNAKKLALENFVPEKNSKKILSLYNKLLKL